MSAETPGLSDHEPNYKQNWGMRFKYWRWQRPFWAGLLTMAGGVPIAALPYLNLTLGQLTVRLATTAGAGALIIGLLLVTLGLTMWFQPVVRVFAGVAAILLSLVSIPVSNFGGIIIGFVLGLLGGSLSIAWAPDARTFVPVVPDWVPEGHASQPEGRPEDQLEVQPEVQPEAEPEAELEHQPSMANAGADEVNADDNGRNRAG